MATLTNSMLDLADIYKRSKDPNEIAVGEIIEMMNGTAQDIFDDFVMMECNQGTTHLHTIRDGLSSVSWGALYEGIVQSKSSTHQVEETTGFCEGLCTIDERIIDLAGSNAAAIRASESEPAVEAMAQELVTSMFYHNPTTNPRLPKGLGVRFGEKATSGAGNQIVDAGGTGSDNTSIWFVTWGGKGFNALHPKGTTAGIQQKDMGRQRVLDANGNPYYAVEEKIMAHMGFSLGDYRHVARIANVDLSAIQAGDVDLYGFMRKAYYKLHGRRTSKVRKSDGRDLSHTVIYANKDVLEALDGLATNSGSSDNFTRLRYMEVEGKEVLAYRDMPIRETDALLNTEARIV